MKVSVVGLVMSLSAVPALAQPGPASAGKGTFGLRANLSTGGVPVYSPVPGAVANAPTPVGTVGVTYFTGDALALLIEVGAGVALAGGDPRPGFSAGFGVDYHFRTPADALRPLLHAQVILSRAPPNDLANTGQDLPWLTAQVAGGAEYFVSRYFSVSVRLGVGVAARFGLGAPEQGGGVIVVSTVTPGIGAAWYF
jgi:hypothetical protein